MKCVITGQNASTLAKAINSFARIGIELYLEATATGLSLRTVNMTKSAYASIIFGLDFFSSFVVKAKNADENHCKLSMKSCLGVFRNMKQVESCTITLDAKSHKLIVQFMCRLETIRTHQISILEHESLQAAYLADRSLNIVGANYKIFSNIASNFKANEEDELSFIVNEKNIVIQNYEEGVQVDNEVVRSQITLKSDDFENFNIGKSTSITFCLRELRAILIFAESMNTSITAKFDTAGDPVVFVIKDYDTLEAKLVMSTLSPDDEESGCQRSQSMVQINSQHKNSEIQRTNTDVMAHKHQEDDSNEIDSNTTLRKRNLSTANSIDFEFSINKQVEMDVLRKKRRTSTDLRDTHLPNVTNKSDQTKPSPPAVHIDLESENIDVIFQEDSIRNDAFSINNNLEDSERQETNDIHVNGRDHRPKVRQVFNRCFTGNTQPVSYGEILAEASDEEI